MSSDNSNRPNRTGRLGPEERRTLTIPAFGAAETRAGVRDITYHLVPSGNPKTNDTPIWRVLLTFGNNNQHTLAGLDIHADTMVGRSSGE